MMALIGLILFVTTDIYEKVKIRRLKCIRSMKKTECVVKTHDRSETFVLQGNIVIIHQSFLNSIFTTKLYILMKKIINNDNTKQYRNA
jgi:hypothetical protein